MFNILIVDDDQIDIEGLSRFVNWKELGYNVIGSAHSATEAVGIIETEYVDVVLTDIVMPGKNGLELIKDALEINPNIKTVLLSGHSEFQYAKEALRLGAFDYLMKPVDFNELKSIFEKLKISLHEDILAKQKQVEFMKILRMQFLNNIAGGVIQNPEYIHKKAYEIGIDLTDESFCIIRFLVLNEKSHKNLEHGDYDSFKSALTGEIANYLESYGKAYAFENNISEISVIFYPKDLTKLESILKKLMLTIDIVKSINLYLGVGGIYNTVGMLSHSYREAGKALDYRYINKSSLLFYKNMSRFITGKPVVPANLEESIQEHLLHDNEEAFEEHILNIISELYTDNMYDRGVLLEACIEILLIINRFLGKYHSREVQTAQSDHNVIGTLLKIDNYEEIKKFISSYLRKTISGLHTVREKPLGLAIESVLRYINEHYNENLSLQKLSDVVYMHPTYLSKLFKEKTGENFSEYIMKVRIEQSKKLLQDLSLRMYDVCEMVGYDSPKHFGRIFKEITGITPKDFRKQSKGLKQ